MSVSALANGPMFVLYTWPMASHAALVSACAGAAPAVAGAAPAAVAGTWVTGLFAVPHAATANSTPPTRPIRAARCMGNLQGEGQSAGDACGSAPTTHGRYVAGHSASRDERQWMRMARRFRPGFRRYRPTPGPRRRRLPPATHGHRLRTTAGVDHDEHRRQTTLVRSRA